MNGHNSPVRQERSGWRDERISRRHRQWGWDCPAIDIDFLLIEYDRGRAVALVEYKHETAIEPDYSHPSYSALVDLGNRAGLPIFVVRHAHDFSWWWVTALNSLGEKWLPEPKMMDERQWVGFLYTIRGRQIGGIRRE